MKWPLVLILLAGCTPAQVAVKATPADATKQLQARYEEAGIAFDPQGSTATQLRSRHYCYVKPDPRTSNGWAASLAAESPGPLPFVVEAPMSEQRSERQKCEYIFRFVTHARTGPSGTQLSIDVAWWRAQPSDCKPAGDPLLGVFSCNYRYRGAVGPADPTYWLQSHLSGL